MDTKLGIQKLPIRGHLDLFTDGSCLEPQQPWASLGAWAIVSATDDIVVANGVLGGHHQTSDRAELIAKRPSIMPLFIRSMSPCGPTVHMWLQG